MSKKLHVLETALPHLSERTNIRIGIVKTQWNTDIVEALYTDCISQLRTQGITLDNIFVRIVPGAFELAHGAQQLLKKQQCDVVICIGALIQGATYHFEVLANAVTHALQTLSITCGVPVIFGVLTCNHEQAVERVGDGLAKGWADSALMMVQPTIMRLPLDNKIQQVYL